MHNSNLKTTQLPNTAACLGVRLKRLAAHLCSEPQHGCCGMTVGLSWLITGELLIRAQRDTWICGCFLAQHRIRAMNFNLRVVVFCWKKRPRKPTAARFGLFLHGMYLKRCILWGKGSNMVDVKYVQSISWFRQMSHSCPLVRPWVAHSKDQQAGT